VVVASGTCLLHRLSFLARSVLHGSRHTGTCTYIRDQDLVFTDTTSSALRARVLKSFLNLTACNIRMPVCTCTQQMLLTRSAATGTYAYAHQMMEKDSRQQAADSGQRTADSGHRTADIGHRTDPEALSVFLPLCMPDGSCWTVSHPVALLRAVS
jgi:hypothetical protein